MKPVNKLNNIINNLTETQKHLLILGLFVILTLIVMRPLDTIVSTPFGDANDAEGNMWNLWWTKQALLNFQNPYVTDHIFYPQGTTLYLHSFTPINGILSIPFQILMPNQLIFIYNLFVLFSFIFSGFTLYVLAQYLTKNRFASILAGSVFTFGYWHYIRYLGHLNMLTTQFIPLFILFFIQFHEKQTIQKGVLALVTLILVFLSSWYHILVTLALAGLYVVYYIMRNKITKEYLLKISIFFLLFFIITSPILIPAWQAKQSNTLSNHDPDFYTPNIATFLIPSEESYFFQNIKSHQYRRWFDGYSGGEQGTENQNYLGYTVLFFALLALLIKKKEKKQKYYIAFFGISTLIFLILNLGTVLKAFSNITTIKLPYYYIYQLFPFISIANRFNVVLFLSLTILLAYGITYLLEHKPLREKMLIGTIIFLCLFIEFYPIPTHSNATPVPSFYEQLRLDKEEYAILDLTARQYQQFDKELYDKQLDAMFYQTIHEKKTTLGMTSRPLLPLYPFYNSLEMRILNECKISEYYCRQKFHSLDKLLDGEGFKNYLQEQKIKYIIITAEDSDRFIKNNLLMPEIYSDKYIQVFQVY